MKISLNWLRDFVDLPTKVDGKALAAQVTSHTAEVEGVHDEATFYEGMVIGKIVSVAKHPNADRLNVTQTDIGGKVVQIVCGGQNLVKDMLVAVALPGAWVNFHGAEYVQLTEIKIRGVDSFGMICAGEEIGLTPDNDVNSKTDVRIHDLTHLKVKPGTPLAKALHKDDILLEVDNKSLTHRPDLWGHYGMAREVAAIVGKPLKKLDSFLKIAPVKGKEKVRVDIKDAKLCPRFSACIMSGIRVEESPEWLKSRLMAAGMNAHNTIVDITNYVMLELGQPMHAYDRTQVRGDHFIVRYANKGEKLVTLDGNEHSLVGEDPLVCDGDNTPLGLAGIKGGLKSGISDETHEIILECANFDPVIVRKSTLHHALRTDASQRFEKSLDPNMTEIALKRAIHLIQKLCPTAKVVSPLVTSGTWKPKKMVISVSTETICKKIGVPIPNKEIVGILKALDFGVSASGKTLKITVPSHRATRDISIEEDIVEEVARMYGYDKIPALSPKLPVQLPNENEERFHKHKVRNLFALGLGFTELVNYSFYNKNRLTRCGMSEKGHLKILNYLSEDQTHLRTSLVPNLLNGVAINHRRFPQMKVFELGRTYEETAAFMPREEKHLAAAVTDAGEAFYVIKGALEAFLKEFGVKSYKLKASEQAKPYAHPKKSVDIIVQGKCIGEAFVVHPATLKAFDIPVNTALFEIKFSDLVKAKQKTHQFEALPKFPSMSFDVSVVVDKQATVAELEHCIRTIDTEKLLKDVRLFDTYEGKGIPEGKKSLSFSLEIRRDDRTLTDKELQAMQEQTFLALEQFGGKIRGR